MTQKIIIADTNIIIHLCIGSAFQQVCSHFDISVTNDVILEIREGRAPKLVVERFFSVHGQGDVGVIKLLEEQNLARDVMMERDNLGLGEASSIIAALDHPDHAFATTDTSAFLIAQDSLGAERTVTLEDILHVMIHNKLLNTNEVQMVRDSVNS